MTGRVDHVVSQFVAPNSEFITGLNLAAYVRSMMKFAIFRQRHGIPAQEQRSEHHHPSLDLKLSGWSFIRTSR